MAKLTINVDNCKGCGLCVDVCPKNVLELSPSKINKKEFNWLRSVDE